MEYANRYFEEVQSIAKSIDLTTIEQHLLNRDFDLIVNCTSLGMKGGLHEDGFAKILDYQLLSNFRVLHHKLTG